MCCGFLPNNQRLNLHPRSLTCNLKMMVSERNLLFQWLIFRFHLKLQGVESTKNIASLRLCDFPLFETNKNSVGLDSISHDGSMGLVYIYLFIYHKKSAIHPHGSIMARLDSKSSPNTQRAAPNLRRWWSTTEPSYWICCQDLAGPGWMGPFGVVEKKKKGFRGWLHPSKFNINTPKWCFFWKYVLSKMAILGVSILNVQGA